MEGEVRDAQTGARLSQAGVAVVGGGGTLAVTGPDGHFRWDGESACRELRVTAHGYVAKSVALAGGVTEHKGVVVELAAVEATSARVDDVRVKIDGAGEVGYSADVTLRVELTPADPVATYAWTQRSGPRVAIAGETGPALQFRTVDLALRGLDARKLPFGAVALSPAHTPSYEFQVRVASRGKHYVAAATVGTGEPQASWPRALIGTGRFVAAGPGVGRPAWQLTVKPPRSELVLAPKAAASTLLRLVPDVAGHYELREARTGKTFVFEAGGYFGAEQCGRSDCHPTYHQAWRETRHATVMERGFRGELGPDYGYACWKCHALGSGGRAALAKGFDRAFAEGLAHAGKTGVLKALDPPDETKGFAGVQCEHCHGPGRFWTGFASDVCAQCHDAPPTYTLYRAWQTRGGDTVVASAKSARACSACHTAQGFAHVAALWGDSEAPAIDNDARSPHACLACHDPHNKTVDGQVRIVAGSRAPRQADSSQVCVACHSGPAGDEVFATRAAPHPGAVADILNARAGYRGNKVPHQSVPKLCVGCHLVNSTNPGDKGHALWARPKGVPAARLSACVSCHQEKGLPDAPDLTKPLLAARVRLDLAVRQKNYRACGGEAAARLVVAGDKLVLANVAGRALKNCAGDPLVLRAEDRELHELGYALVSLQADRAVGEHNADYAREVVARVQTLVVSR